MVDINRDRDEKPELNSAGAVHYSNKILDFRVFNYESTPRLDVPIEQSVLLILWDDYLSGRELRLYAHPEELLDLARALINAVLPPIAELDRSALEIFRTQIQTFLDSTDT